MGRIGDELSLLCPGCFNWSKYPIGQPPYQAEKNEPSEKKYEQAPEQQIANVGGFVAAIYKGNFYAFWRLANTV